MEGSYITEHYTPAVPAPLKTQIGLQYLCGRTHRPNLYRRRFPGNTPPSLPPHTHGDVPDVNTVQIFRISTGPAVSGVYIFTARHTSLLNTHTLAAIFAPPPHHDHKCHIIVMYSHRLKVSAMASRPRSRRPSHAEIRS